MWKPNFVEVFQNIYIHKYRVTLTESFGTHLEALEALLLSASSFGVRRYYEHH